MVSFTKKSVELVFKPRSWVPIIIDSRRFQVTFERGAVIRCQTKTEAEEMTASHLARAQKNCIQDRVIQTIWLSPKQQRRKS